MVTWHLNEQPSQDSVHQLKNFVIKRKEKKKKKALDQLLTFGTLSRGLLRLSSTTSSTS